MTINILFQLSKEDEPYINLLKGVFNNTDTKVSLNSSTPSTLTEVVMRMREKHCTCIAVTEPKILQLLMGHSKSRLPTIDDYAGSLIVKAGVEWLILPPIKHIISVTYGKFLYQRYLSKFITPKKWLQISDFHWEVFNPQNTERYIRLFSKAAFMSCDIETGAEDDRVITCVGFTAVVLIDAITDCYDTQTIVVPFTDMYNIAFIRTLLALPTMKVFQNGKYDNAYLLRFNCITYNWGGDTINLFHSWLSELPKDLAFIATFTIREWHYWKNESVTTDIMEYYRYNAKDCFATAISWLSMILEVPPYVWKNYYQEFPLVFPCLLTEMIGLKRDQAAMAAEEERFTISLEKQLISLQKMVGCPSYNPGSWQQTLRLFDALGSGDLKSTDAKNIDRVADRHPINRRIVIAIKKYREDRKMVGTYLRDTDPKGRSKTWHGRMFYALNPHGTDTGRLASKESQFWCGWQIQNIPRDRDDIQVKEGIIADNGFFFGEADYAQNEARGTAYISGDTKLIAAVDDITRDFHGINASSFFGVPYNKIVESIYNEELKEWHHKTIDKELRNNIGKRINHGANYNMQEQVMLDTMGIANVRRAQLLLSLPAQWSLLRVCKYLLSRFDETYPVVRGAAYDKIREEVMGTGFLIGPTDWTRRCFGNPITSKHMMNAYAAHKPQSLAAMQLNKAYLRVFQEVAIPNPRDFKLGPQIHDSILFQYKKGRKDLAFAVKDKMKIPIAVTDIFGKTRVLTVPVDLKGEAERWSRVEVMRLL